MVNPDFATFPLGENSFKLPGKNPISKSIQFLSKVMAVNLGAIYWGPDGEFHAKCNPPKKTANKTISARIDNTD